MTFKTFHLLVLSLACCAALLLLAGAVRLVPVGGENVYAESAGVLAAQRWVEGHPLYGDYRQPPYLTTAFTPVWYAVMFSAAKAGLSGLDSLTLFGRIFSLAAVLGIAFVAFRWNRRLGYSIGLALLAPCFYFSFPPLMAWLASARPDFPTLFFVVLAIYIIGGAPRTSSVVLAAISAALAFLMKHNAVAAPVAIVLTLAWARRWRHAALFCVVWGAMVIPTLVLWQRLSGGLFLLNISGASFGQFALTYIRDLVYRILAVGDHGFAIVLASFGVLGLREAWSDNRQRIVGLHFTVALALALFGSASAGAGVNHFFEPLLALAMLVPAAFSKLRSTWKADSPILIFATATIVLLLAPSIDLRRWQLMHTGAEDLRRVLPLVEKRAVFTDIPYLAARTSPPQLVDLASLVNTARVGGWAGWRSEHLATALQNEKYDLVILSQPVDLLFVPAGYYPRWPRVDSSLRTAIARHYVLCSTMDGLQNDQRVYIYRPGSSTSSASCGIGNERVTASSVTGRGLNHDDNQ